MATKLHLHFWGNTIHISKNGGENGVGLEKNGGRNEVWGWVGDALSDEDDMNFHWGEMGSIKSYLLRVSFVFK